MEKQSVADLINHPPHYTYGGIEVLDVIEGWGCNYHVGNTVKYLARAGHKDDAVSDLKKAAFYLKRYWHGVRNKPSGTMVPPFVNKAEGAPDLDAVCKAWDLDDARRSILSDIYYGFTGMSADATVEKLQALADVVAQKGAKEALCPTPSTSTSPLSPSTTGGDAAS